MSFLDPLFERVDQSGDPVIQSSAKIVKNMYEESARYTLTYALGLLGCDMTGPYIDGVEPDVLLAKLDEYVRWLEERAVEHALNSEKNFPMGRG